MPSGFCAWAEETRTKRPCGGFGERVVEGAGGVLHGVDEEVVEPLVVGERRRGDRVAALPAADEVDEGVGAAEALLEVVAPLAGGVVVQEVDLAEVDALGGQPEVVGERLEPADVDVGEREVGALVGEAAGDVGAQAAAGACDRDRASFEGTHAAEATGAAVSLRPVSRPSAS